MENEKDLFGLNIDVFAKTHLVETSKWARFLAIIGVIGIGLIIIFCTLFIINPHKIPDGDVTDTVSATEDTRAGLVFMLFFAVLYFFPCYFILRFSGKMKDALNTGNGVSLNEAFKNLKIAFRYVGILTIIFLVLMGIGIIDELTRAI
jgi:hypothetical protein